MISCLCQDADDYKENASSNTSVYKQYTEQMSLLRNSK